MLNKHLPLASKINDTPPEFAINLFTRIVIEAELKPSRFSFVHRGYGNPILFPYVAAEETEPLKP